MFVLSIAKFTFRLHLDYIYITFTLHYITLHYIERVGRLKLIQTILTEPDQELKARFKRSATAAPKSIARISSATFETKSCYCRVARQALPR